MASATLPAPTAPAPAVSSPSSVAELLAAGGVRAVYQPIVELPSRKVAAWEALARGPQGSALESPAAMFGTAAREGLVAELDLACRVAALDGAVDAGLRRPATLFVNAEPDVLGRPSEDLKRAIARADGQVRVIAEITERRLADRPAELLRAVTALRARGWGFALDDVGADWRSLALMPFVRPDVVKLDMRLVQERPDREIAAIARAVSAYAERSGAAVLAEGIETEEHEARAVALGATLGQGWHYGRPGALQDPMALLGEGAGLTEVAPPEPAGDRTPVQIVQDAGYRFTEAPKELLLAHSIAIEERATRAQDPCVVLGAFEHAGRFTPHTAHRYAEMARTASFVGAFGVGMGPSPAPGVRGGDLGVNERLAGEWDVVVVGPHDAAALVARDLGDRGPDRERRFAYALVEDREVVVRAARALMLRIAAS